MLFLEQNGATWTMSMVTFDESGQKAGQRTISSKGRKNRAYMAPGSMPQVFAGDGGFFVIINIYKGMKFGYEVLKVDGEAKTDWESVMMPKKGAQGVAAANEAHGQLALITFKRDKLMTREATSDLVVMSSEDGKTLLTSDLTDGKHARLALSVFVDDDGSIILGGNYWEGTKLSGSPDGVFFRKVNAQGETMLESLERWDGGVSKLVNKAADRGILTTKPYLMFQTVEKSASGDYIAVGETYYNGIGGGIAKSLAHKALSGETRAFIDIIVEDFVLLQFDGQTGELEAASTVDKFKSTYTADMAFAGFAGALYINYMGYFDYVYTQEGEDGTPVLVYTDFDRSSREKQGLDKSESKAFVGFADISDISNVTVSKHNFKRKLWDGVVESKPGSYLVYEYNKKEKALTLTVEALEE
jgi:hypothetical protein